MIPESSPLAETRVENTMPEKNSGQVSTTAVSKRPRGVEAKPPALAMAKPAARLAHKNRYGIQGRFISSHRTAQFARNAITKILAITTPITSQVFPKVKPNSVIPFVSTNIKPTPRKKKDK